MMAEQTVFEELAAAKAEIARARNLRLTRPADAVDPEVHTPERVTAYLASQGWARIGGADISEVWQAPGHTDRFVSVPLEPHAGDYRLRVGILAHDLANWAQTGELEILAQIAGMPRTNWTDVCAAQLLPIIQAEGGEWAGARASSALFRRHGFSCSPERAVQFLQRLEERGTVVNVRPPRGRTFTLPFGPGGEVRYEWSTNQGGHADPDQLMVAPEAMARSRHMNYPELHPKLLRRPVTYGPWVEVPVESEACDD